MAEYLISFNGEWVPERTDAEMTEISKAVRALIAEMKAAGVHVFTGGLEETGALASVDLSNGEAVVSDGPYAETKEHLGGITIVDVPDDAAARLWAGRIATACTWPQELYRFQPHGRG